MAKKPETETAAAPVNNTPTPEAEAPAPVQLGVQDLQNAAQIIDIAMSRGAFRANELSNVGGIADKLTKFLQHVADQQKAQQEEKAKAEGGAIDEGKIGDAQPAQAAPEQK